MFIIKFHRQFLQSSLFRTQNEENTLVTFDMCRDGGMHVHGMYDMYICIHDGRTHSMQRIEKFMTVARALRVCQTFPPEPQPQPEPELEVPWLHDVRHHGIRSKYNSKSVLQREGR